MSLSFSFLVYTKKNLKSPEHVYETVNQNRVVQNNSPVQEYQHNTCYSTNVIMKKCMAYEAVKL